MMGLNLKLPPQQGNKMEQAFGLFLHSMLQQGKILWYRYEPIKLCIGKGAWYTPDFGVVGREGEFIFYEVKGFFREAAKVRLKVARSLYPFFRFVVVRYHKGEWTFEAM